MPLYFIVDSFALPQFEITENVFGFSILSLRKDVGGDDAEGPLGFSLAKCAGFVVKDVHQSAKVSLLKRRFRAI
jgi:hypothetical protein